MSDSLLRMDWSRLAIDAAGWVAMVLIVSAYALVSSGRIKPDSPTYQWLNIIGALGFILNSGANGAYPSAALNVIWVGIGAGALIRSAKLKGAR